MAVNFGHGVINVKKREEKQRDKSEKGDGRNNDEHVRKER